MSSAYPVWPAEVQQFMVGADVTDIKQFESPVDMRRFVAGMFSYNPGWIKFLYSVRWGFVRLLGMKQDGIPQSQTLAPQDVPMQADTNLAFFHVKAAKEDAYWVADATEKHLTAVLGVVREPLAEGKNRYWVLTLVHYHHWTGPVYFNVIRPFHHLVVNKMARSGAAG